MNHKCEGILLVDKQKGSTSFDLIRLLRRKTKEKKIGHAGTLDPLATGLMVCLIGKNYTRKAQTWLQSDKRYIATLHLGIATDTYDRDGIELEKTSIIPSLDQVEKELQFFQGKTMQIPPMFSAKKKGGKKLYELARQGITVERAPVEVTMHIALLSYSYPDLVLDVTCSKGTYIRSLAYDFGEKLKCKAHLKELRRLASGPFSLEKAVEQSKLDAPGFLIEPHLIV